MDTVSARASPPERPRALPRPQMQRLPRVAACWLLQCTQCHTLYARSHQHRSCAGRRPAQATQLPEALTAGQLSERAERVHALRWVPAVVCCNRAAPRLVGRAASPRGPAPPRGLTPRARRPRYLVSQHPAVEARVVAELDALELLVTPKRPHPRALEWADLGRLTYLQAVIKARARPWGPEPPGSGAGARPGRPAPARTAPCMQALGAQVRHWSGQ